jgi:hypothetical protein
MPRPQSEITGKQIRIGARVTLSQREMFKKLGGSKWLRKQLTDELERKWVAKKSSIGSRIISRVFGK